MPIPISRRRRRGVLVLVLLQALAAIRVAMRLARGRDRLPTLSPPERPPAEGAVSVVVPARDEAARIGPCLDGLMATGPEVGEILVVDDQSTDITPVLVAEAGRRDPRVRLVSGRPLPAGWVGKPWALDQGLRAARGRWLLAVDADARPDPALPAALVDAVEANGWDGASAAPRFAVDTPAERVLHPSLLATLVYRYGPVGLRRPAPPARALANGQCMLLPRARLEALGGYGVVRGAMTDDVALARALGRAGLRLGFLHAGRLLEVKMHDSGAEAWREWGRSLALPGVEPPLRRAADVGLVALTLGLPAPLLAAAVLGLRPRGAAGAGLVALNALLVAQRLALLAPTAGSYSRRGALYWLSPLADPVSTVRLAVSAVRPPRTWRGRSYVPASRA